jgi:hypothetical protein
MITASSQQLENAQLTLLLTEAEWYADRLYSKVMRDTRCGPLGPCGPAGASSTNEFALPFSSNQGVAHKLIYILKLVLEKTNEPKAS